MNFILRIFKYSGLLTVKKIDKNLNFNDQFRKDSYLSRLLGYLSYSKS